jgi:4a-hydroxytetrahydrobiopterin dehydratase
MKKETATMDRLQRELCQPCKSGSAALSLAEQQQLQGQLQDWKILPGSIAKLQRMYRFRDFRSALRFTNAVGQMADEENHHPALLTEWGAVTVTWWTHSINGLHRNDFILAARTDDLYLLEKA